MTKVSYLSFVIAFALGGCSCNNISAEAGPDAGDAGFDAGPDAGNGGPDAGDAGEDAGCPGSCNIGDAGTVLCGTWNPANTCQSCQPAVNAADWSDRDGGDYCHAPKEDDRGFCAPAVGPPVNVGIRCTCIGGGTCRTTSDCCLVNVCGDGGIAPVGRCCMVEGAGPCGNGSCCDGRVCCPNATCGQADGGCPP